MSLSLHKNQILWLSPYVSNKNMQAELTDTTETVARNTFLKRFLHPLRAMLLEAREEISLALNCSSTAVVISTQHPFCQATGICLLLELKSPIHLPNLIITKKNI